MITNKLEHTGATIYVPSGSGQTELDIDKVKRDVVTSAGSTAAKRKMQLREALFFRGLLVLGTIIGSSRCLKPGGNTQFS